MDPAWIVVIGTLGGVIVTASSAVPVAALTCGCPKPRALLLTCRFAPAGAAA